MRPVVKSAQQLELTSYRQNLDQKEASWILKQANEADLALDEDLKHEVVKKLSGSKRTFSERGGETEGDAWLRGDMK